MSKKSCPFLLLYLQYKIAIFESLNYKLLCIMGQDFLDKLYLTLLGGVGGGDGISLKKTLLYSIPRKTTKSALLYVQEVVSITD